MMNRCLYCYKPLEKGEHDFHKSCARKIFGQTDVPELPYSHDRIEELAKDVIRSQTAVTGVQPKLSLDIQPHGESGTKRFTIVGLWGKYILKPQTPDYPELPELEDLTMHMAQAAKISTVPHSLIRFKDGRLGYITLRIDRTLTGDKIPMEDMCQLTERLTEFKYKGSYEQVAKAIQQYSSVPMLDLIRFWEIVIFSWLTGNSDMHLKNFSLYSPRDAEYELTPAYDLLSTLLVMPEDTEELALTVNGKKRKIRKEDFVTAMKKSGLSEKVIENTFKRFRKVESTWMDLIDRSFVSDSYKSNFKSLLSQRLSLI